MILDNGALTENLVGNVRLDAELGPGALCGTGTLKGEQVTVIASDAKKRNPRFPVVYAGIIGMEEAYKMAASVYETIAADREKPLGQKRAIVLIVDSPGNGPGKIEEIFGMNKATGSYQLALTQARQMGHPVIAMIIGRAISGAFLCHGLQADRILTLPREFGTMIHVMPLSSIARITKRDIETLETLSKTNPVFASGAEFFYQLGGVEEIVNTAEEMRDCVSKHIGEVRADNAAGACEKNGPWGRGTLGAARGGRTMRAQVLTKMAEEFAEIEREFL